MKVSSNIFSGKLRFAQLLLRIIDIRNCSRIAHDVFYGLISHLMRILLVNIGELLKVVKRFFTLASIT